MSFKGGLIQVRGAEGQAYAGQVLLFMRIPEPCRVIEAVLSALTLPAGSSLLVDVRKNGTSPTDSIFLGDAAMAITTSNPATNGHYEGPGTLDSTDAGRVVFVAGDELWVVVTQVGSSYSSSDILVQIRTS